MSGYGPSRLIEELSDGPSVDFLAKPFNSATLREKLTALWSGAASDDLETAEVAPARAGS